MKILIAGSHGIIGSSVTPSLVECGHEVFRLVRIPPGSGQVGWDPDAAQIDASGLEGFDGVMNLATAKTLKEKCRTVIIEFASVLAKALEQKRVTPSLA